MVSSILFSKSLFCVSVLEISSSSSAPPTPSLWLAPNPSKRWGELFFLLYTPFWLSLSLGIVVPYKLYEVFLLYL